MRRPPVNIPAGPYTKVALTWENYHMFRASGERIDEGGRLTFEKPSETKTLIIPEQGIGGLVINRESPHVITLMAAPVITCCLYIFSFKTFSGSEKAIICHVTSTGLPETRYQWIASQLRKETDLSLVSVIIASPGGKDRTSSIRADMAVISGKYAPLLQNVGLTGKITVLFGCDACEINSRGTLSTYTITERKTYSADLICQSLEGRAASSVSQDIEPFDADEERQSTCLIL
ncbi:hypothetical protein [Legionella geestiana]|uniref:hypothetical protein n=1 Tax=Legionella geestiana TaxID=45065 RepID=UPI001652A6C7|nr:hypothetical protein [Legionella geestiana]